LILAAGRGERFRAAGGHSDKLDAPLTTAAGTRSVLAHVIAAAQASGLPWHLVRAADTAHHPVQGMGTSIATGVAATASASGWLVLPGDLPLVQASSLLAVAQALGQGHAVVQPEVQGQGGHPVGFAAACRDALLALCGDPGARALLAQHAVHVLRLADIGCITDVDTPALLARVQAQALTARQGDGGQGPERACDA
jgi:molybdenum cofactor cytidylyltransferase